MTFAEAEQLASIVESVITALAITIGGGWALWRYVITREGVWNIKMRFEHEVHEFTATYDLLLLYLHVDNVGKVVVRAGAKGCIVTVREIARVAHRPFMIRPDQNLPPLVTEEIINSRGTAKRIQYEIEPGAGYKHSIPLVLPRKILFEVRAEFWNDDDEGTSARAIIDLASSGQRREPITLRKYLASLLAG